MRKLLSLLVELRDILETLDLVKKSTQHLKESILVLLNLSHNHHIYTQLMSTTATKKSYVIVSLKFRTKESHNIRWWS